MVALLPLFQNSHLLLTICLYVSPPLPPLLPNSSLNCNFQISSKKELKNSVTVFPSFVSLLLSKQLCNYPFFRHNSRKNFSFSLLKRLYSNFVHTLVHLYSTIFSLDFQLPQTGLHRQRKFFSFSVNPQVTPPTPSLFHPQPPFTFTTFIRYWQHPLPFPSKDLRLCPVGRGVGDGRRSYVGVGTHI